jgi:eukaryotic-like serine/threonine-protein kinase
MRERYEVVRELGRGGAGTVHLARDRASGTPVAIKTLLPELARDPGIRERFLREGRVRVRHPNVVLVHETVAEEDRLHIVMELMTGGSAEDLLGRGPLPIAVVVRIGAAAASGLGALHAAGVIHRDIKPANILLTSDGQAKLGDLGIAKQGGGGTLTGTGQGMGTPTYCSPEQVLDAKRATPAADLYSLGASLYHLLAGRPPFVTAGLAVIEEILQATPPPLSALRPDAPPALCALVHGLLAKDRDERPPTAAFVARELSKFV